jgi:hypothetical protein
MDFLKDTKLSMLIWTYGPPKGHEAFHVYITCGRLTLQVNIIVDLAALPLLKELSMWNSGLRSLPDSMSSLKHLTSLCLSRNEFTRLPILLTEITTLQFLDMSGNDGLQLRHKDVRTLRALPDLRNLSLQKSGRSYCGPDQVNFRNSGCDSRSGWSQNCVSNFLAIARKLPQLNIWFHFDDPVSESDYDSDFD